MKCAWCEDELPKQRRHRPVGIEAVCWPCWYERYGKWQAVREWKSKRWWRRLVP